MQQERRPRRLRKEIPPPSGDADRSLVLQKMSLKTRGLTTADFEEGWKNIKSPLTKDKIERYEQWSKENGEM